MSDKHPRANSNTYGSPPVLSSLPIPPPLYPNPACTPSHRPSKHMVQHICSDLNTYHRVYPVAVLFPPKHTAPLLSFKHTTSCSRAYSLPYIHLYLVAIVFSTQQSNCEVYRQALPRLISPNPTARGVINYKQSTYTKNSRIHRPIRFYACSLLPGLHFTIF